MYGASHDESIVFIITRVVGQMQNSWRFSIDIFFMGGRIPPNMHSLFALPRSRRPKPTSLRRLGAFRLDDKAGNADVR